MVILDGDSCGSPNNSEIKSVARSSKQQTSIFEKASKSLQTPPEPKATEKDFMNGSTKKTRELYGENEHCYVMDAKSTGNIGRYLNVSFIFKC